MMKENKIGQLIQLYFEENGKNNLLLEKRAIALWEESVGTFVSEHTKIGGIKSGILYVKSDNASLKFELINSRNKIIDTINNQLGCELIRGIIVQ